MRKQTISYTVQFNQEKEYTKGEEEDMRKKGLMIWLIVILVMCAAVVISGCGARQAMPQEDDGSVIASGDGDNVDVTDEKEEEKETEKNSDTSAETAKNQVKPAEDKSIRGIPDAIDTRTTDDGDLLVVVNKYHAVSNNYTPKNLVTIDDKYGTWKNMQLKGEAYDAYVKLYNDAKAQGFDLKLCSTMRSYETQRTLYNNAVKNKGKEVANIRSAYPGRSEHHTGLAIDVTSASMGWGLKQDFADYPDGKWINEHCQEYGFIIRYPKGKTDITGYDYEPWHLRYVGVEAATYIMENGLTLEEYVGQA